MKEMVVNVALTFHVARERVSCNKESLLGRGGEAKAASRKDREDPSHVLSISIKRDFLDFRTFSRSSDLGVKVNGGRCDLGGRGIRSLFYSCWVDRRLSLVSIFILGS